MSRFLVALTTILFLSACSENAPESSPEEQVQVDPVQTEEAANQVSEDDSRLNNILMDQPEDVKARYIYRNPQKIISKNHIAAKLHSNRGAEELFKGDYEKSFYYFKQAIAITPDDSEIWGNLGALLKRNQQMEKAEQALLYSLKLNPYNATSAGNLERLYLTQGKIQKAGEYAFLALKARKTNPYYYYDLARQEYDTGDFKKALKFVSRAKRLHPEDPRFYELGSLIYQRQKHYVKALRELKKAATFASDESNIRRYTNKAKLVAELAAKHQSTQTQPGYRNIPFSIRVH